MVALTLTLAWLGHQYFQVIDNSRAGGFTGKMDRLVQAASSRLGIVHEQKRHFVSLILDSEITSKR